MLRRTLTPEEATELPLRRTLPHNKNLSHLSFVRQRIFRDRRNPLDIYDEQELYERFRFGRQGIAMIVSMVREDLEHRTKRSRAVPAELQVVVALHFLATASFLITSGDTIHVHVSMASRIVHRFVSAVLKHMRQFITFPLGQQAADIQRAFFEVAGFPGIVGAVDGTHIRIQAPRINEENYINRKGSLNVQVIADAHSNILNVVAQWPGSVHDSRVLRTSSIGEKLESGAVAGILLGDSSYACRLRLMTPFLHPSGEPQARYNSAHKTTRGVVERALGQLKHRFHCLHGELL